MSDDLSRGKSITSLRSKGTMICDFLELKIPSAKSTEPRKIVCLEGCCVIRTLYGAFIAKNSFNYFGL